MASKKGNCKCNGCGEKYHSKDFDLCPGCGWYNETPPCINKFSTVIEQRNLNNTFKGKFDQVNDILK